MKKWIGITILILPFCAGAQMKFMIKGILSQPPSTVKVYLSYKKDNNAIRDSAVAENGVYFFQGTATEPVRASLLLSETSQQKRNSDVIYIYLEPGFIHLSGKDSIARSVIKAGPVNKAHETLKKLLKPVVVRKAELYATLTPESRMSEAFLENFRATDKQIEEDKKRLYKQFIAANPSSPVSLDAIKAVGGQLTQAEEVAPLFKSLTPALKNTVAGKAYAAELAVLERSATGQTVQSFTMADTSGKPVEWTVFKGKYVLIDFWASWCGPCRKDNPNLLKTYQAFKSKNFEILGVSLDDKKEPWLKAIRDDKLTWTQLSDLKGWRNELAQAYGIGAIPQNLLISPEGKILARNLHGEALSGKLEQLLGK